MKNIVKKTFITLADGLSFPWQLNTVSWIIAGLFILICDQSLYLLAQTTTEVKIGNFSGTSAGAPLPKGWEPLTFKKIKNHTQYRLVKEDGRFAVKADSHASASGLIHKKRIDPKEYPVLKWEWKVSNILKKGDVYRKEGDDYPARIYIMFEYTPEGLSLFEKMKFKAAKLIYGEYPPTGSICYVWGNKTLKETIVPNAYTDHLKMIIVESGRKKLNTWMTEERNILNDYRRAYDRDPTHISGIAIMTDTDNTGETARAYYGDIILKGLSPN